MLKPKSNIQDCEEALERTLAQLAQLNLVELRKLPALDFLSPKGFRPVVEFYENDRRKRKTASVETWSPENGEIRICFEPAESACTVQASAAIKDVPAQSDLRPNSEVIHQLLNALQGAENTPGRNFVALKWFRDEYLPATGLGWAQNEEQRQSILAQCISEGWILTSKVPNPKAPLYPTTTIRLNLQKFRAATGSSGSRFHPIPIKGEPLSSTILRERGVR